MALINWFRPGFRKTKPATQGSGTGGIIDYLRRKPPEYIQQAEESGFTPTDSGSWTSPIVSSPPESAGLSSRTVTNVAPTTPTPSSGDIGQAPQLPTSQGSDIGATEFRKQGEESWVGNLLTKPVEPFEVYSESGDKYLETYKPLFNTGIQFNPDDPNFIIELGALLEGMHAAGLKIGFQAMDVVRGTTYNLAPAEAGGKLTQSLLTSSNTAKVGLRTLAITSTLATVSIGVLFALDKVIDWIYTGQFGQQEYEDGDLYLGFEAGNSEEVNTLESQYIAEGLFEARREYQNAMNGWFKGPLGYPGNIAGKALQIGTANEAKEERNQRKIKLLRLKDAYYYGSYMDRDGNRLSAIRPTEQELIDAGFIEEFPFDRLTDDLKLWLSQREWRQSEEDRAARDRARQREQNEQYDMRKAIEQSQEGMRYAQGENKQREEPSTLSWGLLGKAAEYVNSDEDMAALMDRYKSGSATDEDLSLILYGIPLKMLNAQQREVLSSWK